METAERIDYLTVEEYFAAEDQSEVRHEYLGGLVYAMAGETRDHNRIAGNVFKLIDRHLAGGPCQTYTAGVRVNFKLRTDDYYYYPDLIVTCDPRDKHPQFVLHPKLLVEVLSPSTERVDRREKLFAYQSIESLEEYVLIGQDQKEVTVFRRANDWKAEKTSGLNASVILGSLALSLPLAAIYEGL